MKDQMKNLLKARPSFNTSAQKETLPSCQAPQPGEGFPLTPPSRETLPDSSLFPVTLRRPPSVDLPGQDFRQDPRKALPGVLYSSQAGGLWGTNTQKPTVKPRIGPNHLGPEA